MEDIESEYIDAPASAGAKKLHHLLALMDREWKARLQTAADLEILRKEVITINNRLDRHEQEAPCVVPIQSLAPEPYEVAKPLLTTVRMVGGEYVALFADANIASSGETLEEAILNLKDLMVGTFELLNETDDSELGPGPSRQKAVLREFIRAR